MKHATVRRRRNDQHRGRLTWVPACPVCKHSHWLPDEPVGSCPRLRGTFTIKKGN
jgi:hypothetical protein